MAQRRMFALTIVDSDAFMDMPLSAQALYFHLAMRADDDGFINGPRKIRRMIGASDDDLKLLIAKNFIIAFESGVIVVKHWNIHNTIQNDRYRPTVYQDEKSLLSTKENKSYTLVSKMDTECFQDGNGMEPQSSLGKVSIGKDSIGEDRLMDDKQKKGLNNATCLFPLLTEEEIEALDETYVESGKLITMVGKRAGARMDNQPIQNVYQYIVASAENMEWRKK